MNNCLYKDPVMRIYDKFEFGTCSNKIKEMNENKHEVLREIKRLEGELEIINSDDFKEYYKDDPEEASKIINDFKLAIDGKNKLIQDYDKEIERCRKIRSEIKTRSLKHILNERRQIGGGNTFSNCKDIEDSTIKFRIDSNKVSIVNQSNNNYDYEFNNDYNDILEFINSEIVKLQKI